jgi:hypothetical protein
MARLPKDELERQFGERRIFITEGQAEQIENHCKNSLNLHPNRNEASPIATGALTGLIGLPLVYAKFCRKVRFNSHE